MAKKKTAARKKTTRSGGTRKTSTAAPRARRRPTGLVAGTTIPDAIAATPQRTPAAPTLSTLFDAPRASSTKKAAAIEPCVEANCTLSLGHELVDGGSNHTDGRGTFWGASENGAVINKRAPKRVARPTTATTGKRGAVEHLAIADQDEARHWGGDAERRDDADGLPDQEDPRHWGGGHALQDGDVDGLPDQDDPRHWGGGRR